MKKIITLLSLLILVLSINAQVDTNDVVLCKTIHFDGIDDYLITDTSSAYLTNDFTIEYWVKIDTFKSTFTFFPSTFFSDKGTRYCWYNYTTNTIKIGFYTTDFNSASTTFILDTNQWYHMAYAMDANDSTYRLYINDSLIIEQAFSNIDITTSPTKMLIGARPYNLENVVAAEFDEVRYWNYARSNQQIIDNMNLPIDPNETGLIGYWNMNDENSNEAVDLSPIYKNAALQNADSSSVWINNCLLSEINLEQKNNDLIIFPNPTHNQITIKTKQLKINKLVIFDIAGKVVKQLTANDEQLTINVSDLYEGIYFVKVNDTDTYKFIKE